MKDRYLTSQHQRDVVTARYKRKQAESQNYKSAETWYRDYTAEEDAFILADNGLKLYEKAEKLRRSYASLVGRRRRLLEIESGEVAKTWRRRKK